METTPETLNCHSAASMSTVPCGRGFAHQALLYRGVAEFVDGVTRFVNQGVARERVMIAVPGPHIDLLRAEAPRWAGDVYFADMTELGRNPGRIIPAVEEFVNERHGRPARFVGETIWAGRNSDEIAEATRHESLINLALSHFSVSVLCPYDVGALPEGVIADGWRTHPEVITDGVSHLSGHFADARAMCRDDLWPLAPPPEQTDTSSFGFDDLVALRGRVHQYGLRSGLGEDRAFDLVLAVNEVASNSIQYGGGSGVLRIWTDQRQAIVCEVRDSGHITDPLEGCYVPGPDLEARGLWLVNQLSDLVELRSGPSGTRVRVRISPRLRQPVRGGTSVCRSGPR